MSIEKRASDAQKLLSILLPDIICVAQKWDKRIDCLVKLPDQSVIGEMIPLNEISDERIMETGRRIKNKLDGGIEPLLNDISLPKLIKFK